MNKGGELSLGNCEYMSDFTLRDKSLTELDSSVGALRLQCWPIWEENTVWFPLSRRTTRCQQNTLGHDQHSAEVTVTRDSVHRKLFMTRTSVRILSTLWNIWVDYCHGLFSCESAVVFIKTGPLLLCFIYIYIYTMLQPKKEGVTCVKHLVMGER